MKELTATTKSIKIVTITRTKDQTGCHFIVLLNEFCRHIFKVDTTPTVDTIWELPMVISTFAGKQTYLLIHKPRNIRMNWKKAHCVCYHSLIHFDFYFMRANILLQTFSFLLFLSLSCFSFRFVSIFINLNFVYKRICNGQLYNISNGKIWV